MTNDGTVCTRYRVVAATADVSRRRSGRGTEPIKPHDNCTDTAGMAWRGAIGGRHRQSCTFAGLRAAGTSVGISVALTMSGSNDSCRSSSSSPSVSLTHLRMLDDEMVPTTPLEAEQFGTDTVDREDHSETDG